MNGEQKTPEQVLGDLEERVNLLRWAGNDTAADSIAAVILELRVALREFLTEHDLAGAQLLSGRKEDFFRRRLPEWEARGLARRNGRRWIIRECAIPSKEPTRADLEADAARAAAQDAQAA